MLTCYDCTSTILLKYVTDQSTSKLNEQRTPNKHDCDHRDLVELYLQVIFLHIQTFIQPMMKKVM